MGIQRKLLDHVMLAVALTIIVPLTLAGCGSAKSTSSSTVGPSVYDAPLGSDAVLLNGTGMNPDAPSATAPAAGGCVSRWINVKGNDINCSDHSQYTSMKACQLNPYFGYANFLVEKCPTTNLIGSCKYSTHTLYYYQGYLIISPSTPVSVLSAGCISSGGTWG